MKTLIFILLTGFLSLTAYCLTAQNAPISTIGTIETYEDTALVSITVTDFIEIGACDLVIIYDSTVAKATAVELGPGIGQFFFVTNVDTVGKIYISWLYFQYGSPGLTLPDNSVFLNFTFERINYGSTAIEFDNSQPDNCLFTNGNFDLLNDIPNSTYYIDGSLSFHMDDAPLTSAASIEECEGVESVDIPFTVTDFYQIGSFNLTLLYDQAVFSYQSLTNNSGFPEMDVVGRNPGTIIVSGISDETSGVILANNSVLFTLHFENLGGATALAWLDDGTSCFYTGPAPAYEPRNDIPQSSFYIDGSFSELPVPEEAGNITCSSGGVVCRGESGVTLSVSPIAFADIYEWTLPEGAVIDGGEGTPEITVSFNDNAISGNVSVYGINECGNGGTSPVFPIVVELAPSIVNQPISPDTVYAGNGIANFSVTASGDELTYQWQEFVDSWVDVTDSGVYSGSTTDILTITNPSLFMDGNAYRCIVNGSCDPPAITDGNAVLSVLLYTRLDINNSENDNEKLNFKSYPNPFSEQITFGYSTPSKGDLRIEIVNVFGDRVMISSKENEAFGNYNQSFCTKQLKPGLYIATITFSNESKIIRNTIKIIARSD